MSNFSLPNSARQRKISRCELKHVAKSHWQISMTKISELGFCSCKPRSLPNTFDKVSKYQRGKGDKVFTDLLTFIKDVGCDKHHMPLTKIL